MIKNKLPKDLNYVPPTNIIIDSIQAIEEDLGVHKKLMGELLKKLVKLRASVDKVQKDFDLLKGYLP